jgi:salicylate hydroxylase
MTTDGMRIAVIGAGISGLTVAAALARSGLPCQVFEQARYLEEVGAGLLISPNGSVLLHRLGAGHALDQVAVCPEVIEVRRWDDNSVRTQATLGRPDAARYGAPFYSVHRADLHQALWELVPEGMVQLGARCLAVTERGGSVEMQFHDGSTLNADVVIGADGIRSTVRGQLLDDEPRFSGHTVYRGVVPPDSAPWLSAEPKVVVWNGRGQHCVAYPICAGKLINFVASFPAGDPAGNWCVESWSAKGRVEEVLEAYAAWNSQLRRLLSGAAVVHKWALYDRPAVKRWTSERIALVGDAAHPMLPFGAQGASQGIEDAMVLAACLREASAQSVPEALRRYEGIRTPRIEQVQRFVQEKEMSHHGEGQRRQERDGQPRESGDRGQRPPEWLFGYDAELAVVG